MPGQNETEDHTGNDGGSQQDTGKDGGSQRLGLLSAAFQGAGPSKEKLKLKANESAAGPSKPTRKPRTVTAKDLDLSITVGKAGEDVSGETFDKLADFIDKNAKMGIISFERGDDHLLLHIQGMISIKSSSTRMVNAQIRQAIGWEDDGPLR
ncbi:hypothetical protein R1sor_005236 [Riccia sorocarpa]|uniref:Uncharacterized protein n=1 Tax=Riccia sorocarpa TaxID=122646 RepID=A0ABD3HMT2_9MARC